MNQACIGLQNYRAGPANARFDPAGSGFPGYPKLKDDRFGNLPACFCHDNSLATADSPKLTDAFNLVFAAFVALNTPPNP